MINNYHFFVAFLVFVGDALGLFSARGNEHNVIAVTSSATHTTPDTGRQH